MARASLIALPMVSGSCVLSDPPVHGQATQTPPILYGNQAVPSPYVVADVSSEDSFELRVPIRSEDDGEPLMAELILNHSIQGDNPFFDRPLGTVFLQPGTLRDEKREVTMAEELPQGLPKGCHQLTLRVTHISNDNAEIKSDVATVTWVLNVDDDSTSADTANQLADCPKATGN